MGARIPDPRPSRFAASVEGTLDKANGELRRLLRKVAVRSAERSERRSSLNQLVTPDAPLAWRRQLLAIRRHYALGFDGQLDWDLVATERDLARIRDISPPEVLDQQQITVAIHASQQSRAVLATLEALKSWSDSRCLAVSVIPPDLDDDAVNPLWRLLDLVPGVVVRPRGFQVSSSSMTLVISAGTLPLPGWAAGMRDRLARPGTKLALVGGHVGPYQMWTIPWAGNVKRNAGPHFAYGFRRDIDQQAQARSRPNDEAIDAVVMPTALSRPLGPSWAQMPQRSSSALGPTHSQRVVIFTERPPRPDRDSGSQDVHWFAQHCLDMGMSVEMVVQNWSRSDSRYAWDMRRLGVVLHLGTQWKGLGGSDVGSEALIAAFGLKAAEYAVPFVRHAQIPSLFVPLDLIFLTVERLARTENSNRYQDLLRGYTSSELLRQRYEDIISEFSHTAVISSDELAYLKANYGSERFLHLPMLRSNPVVSQPVVNENVASAVFVGGFAHPPNGVAMDWLTEQIWPEVRERVPGARLRVFGTGLLEHEDHERWSVAGVELVGRYGRQEEPYHGDVVAVAPLPYGGGVKGKVVTALGHCTPVIGSPTAVQGLPDEVKSAVLVGHDSHEIASLLVSALTDSELRSDLRRVSGEVYEKHYSEAAGALAVREAVRQVRSTAPRGTGNTYLPQIL